MMKKMIALSLVLIMLLSAVPVFAADMRTSGIFQYTINSDNTATVVGYTGTGNIIIPKTLDDYIVTEIGNEAFYRETEMRHAISVTLPETIKSIGDFAFWNMGVISINLPYSLQHIGTASFYGCNSCQYKLPPNHPNFAVIDNGLYNKTNKELIAYSWNLSPYEKNSSPYDINITIPEGIQSIGAYALANTTFNVYNVHLNLSLPSSLTSIKDYAFARTTVKGATNGWFFNFTGNLPNLKTIGKGAFMGCTISACNLIMPAVETIDDEAFADASIFPGSNNVYSIDFTGSPLKQIGNGAFSRLEEATNEHSQNGFIIPVENCSNIGINNKGLGMIITAESDFSPLLSTIPTGLNPRVSSLPSTVTAIQSNAFIEEVKDFRLSIYLSDIAVDAFPKGSTFIVEANSYAEQWCSDKDFEYTIEGQEEDFGYIVGGQEDDLSWLNS